MNQFAKPFVVVFLVYLAGFTSMAFGQDDTLRHVHLQPGISLDVPSHWAEWSPDGRKNLDAAAQTIADNAAVEPLAGKKQLLFAMNATPNPTGAMIRVSTTSPAYLTQDEILSLTPAELEEIRDVTFTSLAQLEDSGGPKIIEFEAARIESVASRPALVTSYVRSSAMGPSPWHVTQYRIPTSNHVVELTLSYRQSDAIMWRPILQRVKSSVNFDNSVQFASPRAQEALTVETPARRSKGSSLNGLVIFFTILFLVGGSYLKRRSASKKRPNGVDTEKTPSID